MKQPTPILLVLSLLAAACGDDAAPSSPDADVADVASDTIPAPDDARRHVAAAGRQGGHQRDRLRADPSEWVELRQHRRRARRHHRLPHRRPRRQARRARVPAMCWRPASTWWRRPSSACRARATAPSSSARARCSTPRRCAPATPSSPAQGRIPDGTGPFVETAPTPQKANKSLDDERATLFRADGPMPVVDLYVDAAAEASLEADHHTYVPAIFTWSDERGTSAPQRIDLRIKGAITDRPWSAKPSLKLHFARHSEPGPRAFRGTKKLALHSMVYDPSTIREWISYEVMRGMGVPAPRVGWAQVR
ncbi:MAG: CotH kinase family protein [Myxococcota bacterium]